MRLHLCFLIGSLGLLGGCETTPGHQPEPDPLPRADETQRALYERAIALFRVGGEEFETVLREGRDDTVLAKALTMFLVFHMRDAERRQRQRQRGNFEIRSLRDNVRYSQARAGLGILGRAALPTVQAELIQNRHTENRLFGVDALAALGTEAVPAIRDAMRASEPRYRRYYVDAVSRMRPSKNAELQLLRWSKDQDFSVRSKALAGLARYGDRHLVLLRGVVLTDPDPFVRRQVIQNLGDHKDRATVASVIDYYGRCSTDGDQRGCREAERTLVRMSGMKSKQGGQRVKTYGLAYWRKWAASLPKENR